MPGRIILISNDLMVVSRVQGAAAKCGANVRAVGSVAAAVELQRDEPAVLILIDLSTPAIAVVDLVNAVKAAGEPTARLVAFGPHVHEEKLAAARAAGCDSVLSRGKFFSDVDSIIAEGAS